MFEARPSSATLDDAVEGLEAKAPIAPHRAVLPHVGRETLLYFTLQRPARKHKSNAVLGPGSTHFATPGAGRTGRSLSEHDRQNVTNGESENAVLERYKRVTQFFARRRRAEF